MKPPNKNKSKSKNNLLSEDDLCYQEEIDENGICELPITGTPVAQFYFGTEDSLSNQPMIKDLQPKEIKTPILSSEPNHPLELANKNPIAINENKALTSYPYGITPPVNGEYLDTRRSFSLRKSTIRMLNELKAADPDINVYLNSIVDKSIRHYHEYIFKEKGSKV